MRGSNVDKQTHPNVLIQHLQSKLLSSEDSDDVNMTNASKWMLYQDDQLATTLHSISTYMRQRIQRVSQSITALEEKQQKLANILSIENTSLLMKNDVQFVENIAADEDDSEDALLDGNGIAANGDSHLSLLSVSPNVDDVEDEQNIFLENENDENKSMSSSDISSVVNNEKVNIYNCSSTGDSFVDNAIANGMNALSLFLDPSLPRPLRRLVGQNETHENSANAIELDSCYYYDSVKEDEFNHRPLPYVVGTVEFNNSVTAGLGGIEDEVNFDDFGEHKSRTDLNNDDGKEGDTNRQYLNDMDHFSYGQGIRNSMTSSLHNPFLDKATDDLSLNDDESASQRNNNVPSNTHDEPNDFDSINNITSIQQQTGGSINESKNSSAQSNMDQSKIGNKFTLKQNEGNFDSHNEYSEHATPSIPTNVDSSKTNTQNHSEKDLFGYDNDDTHEGSSKSINENDGLFE